VKWFILLVGIVVLCFVVALVLGWIGGLGGGLGSPASSLSHEPLPEGELHDHDLDELAFDVTLRGYRMSQVDRVVDRLRRELREKDEHIAFLRSGGGGRAEAGDVQTPPVGTELPVTELPDTEPPVTELPGTELPGTELPGTEATAGAEAHEHAHPHDSPKA
jgi:DivIVA domain-containing protein